MAEQEKPSKYIDTHIHKSWIAGLAALLILFVVFMFGMAAGRFGTGNFGHRQSVFMKGIMMSGDRGFGGMMHSGLINSQDRVAGTVTAVNGSSFTLAGNGSSYSVQTNSSTQWQNGRSVKVNDTVMAFGTTNGGVLTATQVVINP